MLDPGELSAAAAEFGVAESQVELDHLISQVLVALAELNQPIVFFGGTALARTWLKEPAVRGRLSEDIDLYTAERHAVAQVFESVPGYCGVSFPVPAGILRRPRCVRSIRRVWSRGTACKCVSSC